MSFTDGDLYERSIDTSVGVVDIIAEVAIAGDRLELRDLAVYPRGPDRLQVSLRELLGWARLAIEEATDAGFSELRVTGTRLTGAGPGRRVDVIIQLRRQQQP